MRCTQVPRVTTICNDNDYLYLAHHFSLSCPVLLALLHIFDLAVAD